MCDKKGCEETKIRNLVKYDRCNERIPEKYVSSANKLADTVNMFLNNGVEYEAICGSCMSFLKYRVESN